jgi:hypothetical protein
MIKETDSNAIPSGTLLTILSRMFHLILKVNITKKLLDGSKGLPDILKTYQNWSWMSTSELPKS